MVYNADDEKAKRKKSGRDTWRSYVTTGGEKVKEDSSRRGSHTFLYTL